VKFLFGGLELFTFGANEAAVGGDAFTNAIAAFLDLLRELFVKRIGQPLAHVGDLSSHLFFRSLAFCGKNEESERGNH